VITDHSCRCCHSEPMRDHAVVVSPLHLAPLHDDDVLWHVSGDAGLLRR
jgi:hypothetical protein